MTDRLDALTVEEYEKNGQKQTAFTRVGVAWPLRNGPGYRVVLKAMPAPKNGEYTVLLMPPRQQGQQQQRQQQASQQPPQGNEPPPWDY